MAKKTPKINVAVMFSGQEYAVEAFVAADKIIGTRRRKCIILGCCCMAEKNVLAYKHTRILSIKDQTSEYLSSDSSLYLRMEKDERIRWAVERAAGKELNLWLDQREKVDLRALEFQPGGARSIDEDLPLCEYCLASRRNILFPGGTL